VNLSSINIQKFHLFSLESLV